MSETSSQPAQPEIVVYATRLCPYCHMARRLLDALEQPYRLIDVGRDRGLREEMIQRAAGRTSVPQIFIGERHVGGYDDLAQAHHDGRLSDWLPEPW